MRAEIESAIHLLRSSEPDAVDKALALLQDTVFSFSMRLCGQREDAEDTMQEVLVKSLPYLPKFDNPRALLVWLYKVAKNRCLMSRRRSKFAPIQNLSLNELMPDRKELESLRQDGPVNPEALAIRSESARRLREAIQKLPPQYRIVLVMRDMEGLTDDEVAETTGLRPGTVRVRLHRARLFVRKELSKSQSRPHRKSSAVEPSRPVPRRASCKAMFAELSNYLDEQLDDSMCAELEKHMHGCEPCQAFLSTLESTIRQCRRSPKDTPNRRKAAAIRKELMESYERALAGEK